MIPTKDTTVQQYAAGSVCCQWEMDTVEGGDKGPYCGHGCRCPRNERSSGPLCLAEASTKQK
jgi:hypothetical protein